MGDIQELPQQTVQLAAKVGVAVSASGAATAFIVEAMPWLQALGVLAAIVAAVSTAYVNFRKRK